MIGTISKAIGLLLSGWAISRWKFSARFLSGWNVILGLLYFTSLIVFSNVGCPSTPLPIREISECNQGCGCSMDSRIQPICTKDGFTSYYSPCLAGCTESTYNKTSRYTIWKVIKFSTTSKILRETNFHPVHSKISEPNTTQIVLALPRDGQRAT